MSTVPVRKIREGMGSSERPLAKDLLARDSRQNDPVVTEKGNYLPPVEKVEFNYQRYYDRDYARQEYDKIFLKTWQLAAREEDIPNVGDRTVFTMGPGSFIIAHSGPDEYKAFFNSCRHRGSLLCTKKKESGDVIHCPVHGWEWNNSGELLKIPSWWDFPDVQRGKAGGLREVRVSRWGGFIFINADPDAPSLEEELGPIPSHFASYDIANRYTAFHLRKTIRANWKLGQEPFQEAYHVTETHKIRAAMAAGDTQSEYGIWKNGPRHIGVGRIVTPGGIAGMQVGPEVDPVTSANHWAAGLTAFLYKGEEAPKFDPSGDLRKQMADWHRAMHLKYYNRVAESPDTVMTDVIVYFLFPNTLLHLSEFLPYEYSVVPHPTDPELCHFDIRLLLPCPVGKPRPPAAEIVELGPDDRVPDQFLKELDFQAFVLQEDMDNMVNLQKGMKAADPRHGDSHLGLYQESILRHWHSTYDEFMSR